MFKFFKKKIRDRKVIQNTDFVVIDTELTGLDENKDSIVSIGAIKMKGKKIFLGEIFYRHLNPSSVLNKDGVIIHQLMPSELELCPDLEPILREFLSFCKNSIFVGHFLRIDFSFLKKAIRKYIGLDFNPQGVDTYLIFKWLIEKSVISKKYSEISMLSEIAESLGIKPEKLHDSISDAFITAQIFQKEIALIESLNIWNLDFLLKIGQPHVSRYMYYKQQLNYQF